MKTSLIILLQVISFSTTVFANDQEFRIEVMSANGSKEMTYGTILSPPGLGAVGRAEMRAKKKLKAKCELELNGKIVGKIQYETIAFNGSDMTAHVKATGNCQY